MALPLLTPSDQPLVGDASALTTMTFSDRTRTRVLLPTRVQVADHSHSNAADSDA